MYYVFGDYTLDTELRELRCRGNLIKLQPKPFTLLEYLIAHRHSVVTHNKMKEHLYPDEFVTDSALFACIRDARKAIDDVKRDRCDRYIRTINRYGYRFVAEVRESNSPAFEEHPRYRGFKPPNTKVEWQRIQEQIENMRGKVIHVPRIAPTIAVASELVRNACESLCTTGEMEWISEDRYRHRC